MPFDGIVVRSVVDEMNQYILNGKIDKIYQPEKDEVVLSVRSFNGNFKLLISANPSYPRLHFTQFNKENPQTPPLFCMILRKHIAGGKIVDITQNSLERIIEIGITSPNQFGDLTQKKLIVEIMGKYSNIILVDENETIIDSAKHITHETSRVREVLPGGKYVYPPSNKLNPLDTSYDSFENIFDNLNDMISKELVKNYTGISPIIADELVFRCKDDLNKEILWEKFDGLMTQIKRKNYSPTLYSDSTNRNPIEFSAVEIMKYNECKVTFFKSISEVIEKFYYEKDLTSRMKQKSEDIRKQIGLLLDRATRKVERHELTIEDSKDKEKYKQYGDIIFTNIHALSKGDKVITTPNYYSEQYEEISIPLDEQLTPAENAQKYYKIYNKLKSAQESSLKILEATKIELSYFESVIENIEKCTSMDDIDAIRSELAQQGYLRSSSVKKKTKNTSKPLSFESSDGFIIFVGKNNLQNDELTLKTAVKNDIWLHTKLIHGSHVIIKTENKEVPDTTLVEAASLAAYYSKAKNSSNVQVDYTTVKNVKKPSGAKPGMVIYVNYKTVVVDPKGNV